jgi:[ribosomal protein S18]-alanine N-acetyltransferase
MDILVRDFRPDDAPAILEIQAATPQMAQWRAADYHNLSRKSGGIVLIAASTEPRCEVAGFLAAQTLAAEAEIQNLAVRADHRRHGVARALLEEIHRRLAAQVVETVFLEVRVSNLPARNLYRTFGYSECGLRSRYYLSDGEDALVLARRLSGMESPGARAASPLSGHDG